MFPRLTAVLALLAVASAAGFDNPARPLAAARARAEARYGRGSGGVASVGAGGAGSDAPKSYLHMRSDLNQVRIDRLTAAVERAEAEVKSVIDKHDDHEVNHLEERITAVTGVSCPMRQFQCGGKTPQCISNLLICDGSPDCNNGRDEDSSVCVNPIIEGSSWSWNADWGSCVTLAAHTGKFLVTSVERTTSFPSVPKFGLTITTDDDSTDKDTHDSVLSTTGKWSFGSRKLVIFPGTPGFPATVCHFEKGTDNHCEGPLVNVNTWEKCGTITATRYN